MAKVGDKFIIEIGEVFTAKGTYMAYGCEENEYEENLYRIKGFNSLVFDDDGLSKLEKYEPPEEEKSSPVNVGDEIEDENGARWFVTAIQKRNDSVFDVFGVGFDGHTHNTNTAKAKRTGHRNRHIVDALAWTVPVEML